jgi:hypothetical protein
MQSMGIVGAPYISTQETYMVSYSKPITIIQLAVELQRRAKKVKFDPRRDYCPLNHKGAFPARFRMDCAHSLEQVLDHLESAKEKSDGEGS